MPTKLLTILALLFAMIFPTVAAWSYFLGLASQGGSVNARQQAAYVAGKVVQFTFPIVFLLFLNWLARRRRVGWVEDRDPPRYMVGLGPRPTLHLTRPHFRGLKPALIFGLVIVVLMIGVYFGALRGSSMLAQTPARLRHKLQEVDMATPARYVILAVFVVAAHSLLEEYYWRWFVFGGLRQFMPLVPAMALSSLAFMAHHVIVLYVYLPGKFLTAVLPFSLAIAIGGAVWAFLYERSGSIWSPWLSHLIIDAGIFAIGWDLLWPLAA